MPDFMCQHGSGTTLAVLGSLPTNEGSTLEPKCATCAYARGFGDGIDQGVELQRIRLAESRSETPRGKIQVVSYTMIMEDQHQETEVFIGPTAIQRAKQKALDEMGAWIDFEQTGNLDADFSEMLRQLNKDWDSEDVIIKVHEVENA